MERSGAVGVGALDAKPNQPSEHGTPNPLTVRTLAVATPVVAKTGRDRERVTTEGGHFNCYAERGALGRTHGGIRLMSVLEPQPGHVGFFKVVSIKVQWSPLSPQFP